MNQQRLSFAIIKQKQGQLLKGKIGNIRKLPKLHRMSLVPSVIARKTTLLRLAAKLQKMEIKLFLQCAISHET